MEWQAWFVLVLVAGMVVAMAAGLAGPDLILVAGLTALLGLGILDVERAFAGFSNEGVLTVAVLFAVAAGVQETGALDLVARRLLGQPRTVARAQLRLMLPVAAVSGFVNNTPVVAAMLPVVSDWARRCRLPASKLLIPLSYATILGGTCTLIGTSTNLLVAGLAGRDGFAIGLFDVAWVGLPSAAVGMTYVLLASRLLPDRDGGASSTERLREYVVGMRLEPTSPIVGQSIEEAGLRHLPGLFLVEIEREGVVLPAVGPEARLRAHDRLLFAGIVESVVDLRKIKGLLPVVEAEDESLAPAWNRRLVEAVVALGSPLVGRSVRESRFRSRYGAAIIGVHRHGERVAGKVGDIELRPGDSLLLEATPAFLRQYRHDADFAVVAEVEGGAARRHDRAWIAGLAVLGMVAANALGFAPLLLAALLAAGAMIAARCLSAGEAVAAVELRTLVAIAAAIGIGEALAQTGAAAAVGHAVVAVAAPLGPVGVLAGVYLATMILTEMITNNAAAVLMYPIAGAAARDAGMDVLPFLFVLMMAASASFSTPIGYQTNLMVYARGGYRFADFLRFGIPLQLVLAVVAVSVIALIWL